MTLPYDEAGSGPAVLLLHNGLCDRRMWDWQMETFAAAHRVIRCDLRGHGDLPLPLGPFSHTDDVLALLDEVGARSVALVGNSLGAGIALDVCLTAAERVWALVLVGAGRDGWSWPENALEVWRRRHDAVKSGDLDLAVELSLRLWLDGLQRAPGTVGDPLRARVAAMARRALAHQLATPGAGPQRRPERSASDVAAPTLVVTGDLDLAGFDAIAEEYEREIPGARRAVMHGVAHVPSLEQPEEFDRLVLGFLREAHRE